MVDTAGDYSAWNAPYWLLHVLGRALRFRGRSGRAEFIWYTLFFAICVLLVQQFLSGIWLPRVLIVLLAVPLLALTVRRLHDLNLTGWIALLGLVPVISILLSLFLAIRKGQAVSNRFDVPERGRLRYRVAAVGLVVLAALPLRYQTFWIPYAPMKPTLLVGDYLIVDRLGDRVPERGDVVVFRHPVIGRDFIKRVIGLPGDKLQMKGGVLWMNGAAVELVPDGVFSEVFERQGTAEVFPSCANGMVAVGAPCEKIAYIETLPNGRSHQVLDIMPDGTLDTTRVFTVPDGHFFVLGDNRDNSLDSRVSQRAGGIGMVPLENIFGRARWILFSSAGRYMWDVTSWRAGRYFRRVE